MRTSATGNRPGAGETGSGFTLVELMIVLAIMGVASAAVLLAMPDPRGSLDLDAARFAARVRAAEDAAIVGARPLALVVTRDGYGFQQRIAGRWRPLAEPPLEPRRWVDGAQAIGGEAGRARSMLDATGIADPLAVTLVRDGASARVTIGGDGRVNVAR